MSSARKRRRRERQDTFSALARFSVKLEQDLNQAAEVIDSLSQMLVLANARILSLEVVVARHDLATPRELQGYRMHYVARVDQEGARIRDAMEAGTWTDEDTVQSGDKP